MDKNLTTSLALMFGHEGGYSNRKTDSGGPTKYGITHKTLAAHRGVSRVSAEEVKALTLSEAELIYRKSYWRQSGGSLLPSGLDYAAFDYGVNSGPSRAVRSLQRVVGTSQDGIVGSMTIDAVNRYHGGIESLIVDYCDERMRFLRSLGGSQGFRTNGRGWTIRVTGKDPKGQWKSQPGVVGHALEMYRDSTKHANYVEKELIIDEIPSKSGSAKANEKDTALTEVLKKPEAWAPLGGLLSAGGALFSGHGPMQYALAFGVVVGVLVGVYYVVRGVRQNG